MKKNTFKLILASFAMLFAQSVEAQCPTIVCPSDTIVPNDSGFCTAVVTYGDPIVMDTCASGPGAVLVISDVAGATEIEPVLTAEGYTVTVVNNDFSGGDNPTLQGSLDAYDVIFWHASGTGSGSTHNAATFTNLTSYINGGGAIFVHGYDVIASPTDPELITFLGGTSTVDVPTNGGLGTIAGPANSLTDGVTNIVGVTLANSGDHDALVTLTVGTVGVAPNASGWDWSLRTLGSGEIAWVSTGQSTGAFTLWSTPNSGYHEALLNYAYNHSAPSPILTMTSGLSSGSTFPVGTTTVEYEVTDWQGGNPASCSFDVTVLTNIDTAVTNSGTMLTANMSSVQYQWLDCDNNYAIIPGELNQFYFPTASGNYAVEITNQDGCADTSSCHWFSPVGIDELDEFGISLYPNPSNGQFTIETISDEDVSVKVVDNSGRLVYTLASLIESDNKVDLSDLENGVYFVELTGSFGTKVAEIIIE